MLKAMTFEAAFLFGLSCTVQAAPLTAEAAANEFSAESAACAAYYVVGGKCLGPNERADVLKMMRDAGATAAERSMLLGREIGMSEAALTARLQLAVKKATKDIDNSCLNISVLINNYGDTCKAALEDPAGRLREIASGRKR